jgi:hypothetical protein
MPSEAGRTMRIDSAATDLAPARCAGKAEWAGSRAPAAIFLAGCVATVFLVLWPDYLPMVDAPNHLARLTIIAAPEGSALRRMFDVVWTPIPDLGLDLTFLALKGFLSPAAVLRLCVLFAVVAILASACVIQTAAFGRLSWSVAFVPIFVFGSAWHLGLVNYLMGVGVSLGGVAFFVRGQRRLGLSDGIVLGAIGLLAIVCHVAAFAAFMLLVSSLYCAEELAAPSRAAAGAFLCKCGRLVPVFLPGMLFYALCEKPAHTWGVHYALNGKLLAPMLATFGTGTEADVAVFGLTLAIFTWLGVSGGIRVWRRGAPALVLMAAAIILVPSQIDNALMIDSRLMLVLALIALSMTEIRGFSHGLRQTVAMAALTVLIGYRATTMLGVESRYDRDVTEFRAAAQGVDGHAKVLVAVDTTTRADCTRSAAGFKQSSLHVDFGSFLTIDRNAFTPLIFAGRGQQPIRARGEYAPISSPASVPAPVDILQLADDPAEAPRVAALMASNLMDRYVLDWRRDFDDMLVLHSGCAENPFPDELTPMINGPFFTLYRIDRPHAS